MKSIPKPVSDWSFAKDQLCEFSVVEKAFIVIDYSDVNKFIEQSVLVEHLRGTVEITRLLEHFLFEVFTSAYHHGKDMIGWSPFHSDSLRADAVRDAIEALYTRIDAITKEHLPGFYPLCEEHCNCILDINLHTLRPANLILTIDWRAYGSFSKATNGENQCIPVGLTKL